MGDSKQEKEQKLAKQLDETLRHGKMDAIDPVIGAKDRLIPPVEIRRQAEVDPIREETKIIKKIVVEESERYNSYVRNEENDKNGN